MAGTDSTKQKILEQADIVDIVGQHVRLQKRGGNYFGLCPFHNEKTPSFSVNPERGYYHCFGCQKGGNAIDFVMEVDNLTFIEALRYLANQLNIPMDAPSGRYRKYNEIDRYEVMEKAAIVYQRWLDEYEKAADYLKSRGLGPEQMKQFGLGYVPDGWDNIRGAMQRHHIPVEVLAELGLIVPRQSGSGYYDRFRNRIMFPIRNTLGRVIAFGGRAMDPNDNAKYLNSADTPLFNKSKSLYLLDQAKNVFGERGAVLVEGYMDAIALHVAGFTQTVASLGTAITPDHVRLLRRYTDNFTLLYDADRAGINAARRGVEICLEQGIDAKVVLLPDGQDPDDFLKEYGTEAMREKLETAQDGFSFYLDQVLKQHDPGTPSGKVNTVSDMAKLMGLIPDRMVFHDYVQKLASELGAQVDDVEQSIKQQIKKAPQRREEQAAQATQQQPERPSPYRLVKESLIVLLAYHQGYILPEFKNPNQKPVLFTGEQLVNTLPTMLSQIKDNSRYDRLLGALLNDIEENPQTNPPSDRRGAEHLERLLPLAENRALFLSITENVPLPADEKRLRKKYEEVINELQQKVKQQSFEALKRKGDLKALNDLIWSGNQDQSKNSFF